MKIRTLLIAISLLTGLAASPRPASPRPVRMADADGRERLVRIIGNERCHYLVDAETGALLTYDSSDRLVETDSFEEAAGITVADDPSRAPQRLMAYASDGRTVYPTTRGSYRFPVILVEYAGTRFTIADPQKYYDEMFNLPGFSRDGHIGSVRDYFSDCSKGRFVPQFDVSKVVTLPNPSEYYVGTKRKSNFAEAVRYALEVVDADINFSLSDNDNDGSIDHLIVIFAGTGQADSGDKTRVWPHSATYPYTAERHDGKLARSYSAGNELSFPDFAPAGIGGPCYEIARMMGVPELSGDNTLTAATPGPFSLMDEGCYNAGGAIPPMLSAYEQWVLRWLEYGETITEAGRYTLPTLSDGERKTYLLRPDNTSNEDIDEYYIIETRSDEKWDSALPEHGILFWHVAYNEFYWTYNWVNAYSSIRVHTVPSRPEAGMTAWPGGDAADYWMDPTDPTLSKRLNRHTTGEIPFPPVIAYIRYDELTRTGSFIYDTTLEEPMESVEISAIERCEWDEESVRISWPPLSGDDVEYAIKVWRPGEKGIDGREETIYLFPGEWRLTKRPEYILRDFGDAFSEEWMVSIAVVRDVISPLWSEPMAFIPSEARWDSGVTETGSEATAPPQYYTLQGLRVSSPTSPGIYIERRAATTRKIIVK